MALLFSILYLVGFEKSALGGFLAIGLYATVTGIRMQKGTQKARCDLCGSNSRFKVEYEPGFRNVKLVLDCPHCGRVVNKAENGIKPGLEKDV